jgi:hypothetical protein
MSTELEDLAHAHIDSRPLYFNGVAKGTLCTGEDIVAKKKRRKKGIDPCVAFREIHTMWFVCNGASYCVQTAPVTIFREVITPFTKDEKVLALLEENHLDILQRWYLLVEAKKLKLYRNKREAEKSIS